MKLVAQRYEDMVKHSFVYFFDKSAGLVVKGSGTMGGKGCKCPASWSRKFTWPERERERKRERESS